MIDRIYAEYSDDEIENILEKEIRKDPELLVLREKSYSDAGSFLSIGTKMMIGMGCAMLAFVMPETDEMFRKFNDAMMVSGLGLSSIAYAFSNLYLNEPVHDRYMRRRNRLEADIRLNTEKYITED